MCPESLRFSRQASGQWGRVLEVVQEPRLHMPSPAARSFDFAWLCIAWPGQHVVTVVVPACRAGHGCARNRWLLGRSIRVHKDTDTDTQTHTLGR